MKGLTVFLIVTGLALAAANIPVCPEPEEGGEVIQFPNLDDCSTFWKCEELDPIIQKCPGDLWYNPNEKVCDYPANIEEGSCVPPVEETTSEEPIVSTEEPIISTEEPTVSPDEPTVSTEKPTVSTELPTVSPEEPTVSTEKPTVSTELPTVSPEEPTVSPEEPTAPTELPTIPTNPYSS